MTFVAPLTGVSVDGGLVPVVILMVATGAVGLILLALLVALQAHPVYRTRLSRREGVMGGPEPKVPLRSVSTEQLCRAWRYSSATLHRSTTVAERATAAAMRARYLDELERRDPEGFAAWMATAPRSGSDPAWYVMNEPAGRSAWRTPRLRRPEADPHVP